MKSQLQVLFEAELKQWAEWRATIGDDIDDWQRANYPLEGPALWWKVKDLRPGETIVIMPTTFREAIPDSNIFLYDRPLECFAYTINGKEVTR